jgi:PhzF family phenazine biosynthesis protein
MSIRLHQVDAFTSEPFKGNPAAVCILTEPKNEAWMQNVATEMNLSETAFAHRRGDGGYDLRWFTPTVEVELCGHATLATAHVLWETETLLPDEPARFHTKSGRLTAERRGDLIELDFPAIPPQETETAAGLLGALGVVAVHVARPRFDYLVEVASEDEVYAVRPDFRRLRHLGVRGVIVTSSSENPQFDFVSRFFAPGAGIDEDPVTGSAHCALAPYWSERLGKDKMTGYQASSRGGVVHVRIAGDRVRLAGHAVTILKGVLLA